MSRGASTASGLGPLGHGLALGAPALTALTLAAIVGLPPTEPDHVLDLTAPERVPTGAIVPLRAHLYSGVNRPQGPELTAAPTRVELRGPNSSTWTSTSLRTGFGTTLEGMLRVPPDRHGPATLIASTDLDGARVSVERAIHVEPPNAPASPPIAPAPRELPALRSLAVGPVRELPELDFEPLDVRIRGGACVPEVPCELLVLVARAAVAVIAEPSASASVVPAEGTRPGPVASLIVTPHGPEAELRVRLEHDGKPIARAGVRLALALGGHAVASAPDLLRAGEPLRVALHGSERGCIVDAFVDGRWARTASLSDCLTPAQPPFPALEPGRWRVQLRRDRFASDSAAVRELYVMRPGESELDAYRALARAVIALEPGNRSSLTLVQPPSLLRAPGDEAIAKVADPRGNSRYLLAVLEQGIYPLPVPSSGQAAAVLHMQATRARLRKLGLIALGACGLTLAALLGQRGLAAAGEASRLLAAGGSDRGAARRAYLRMTLRVVATLCTLLLVFAALAAYVVARGAAG